MHRRRFVVSKALGATWIILATPLVDAKPEDSKPSKVKELQARYEQLYEQGKYKEAIPLAEKACSGLKDENGPISEEFAECLNNTAMLYKEVGDYKKAQALAKRALSIFQKTLGPKHPTVALGLTNLASLYSAQGVHDDAERLFMQAESIYAARSETVYRGINLHNLALSYEKQGKYDEAELSYEQALKVYERTLDPMHPTIATTLANMGVLHLQRGRHIDAEAALKRALSIRTAALNPEHPAIANNLENLASVLQRQGNYGEAELLHQQAQTIYRKALGPESPALASSLNSSAVLYFELGEYAKARIAYEESLAIKEASLGPTHPSVAKNLGNLATLYEEIGEYEKAESLYEQALSIREESLAHDHPDIASSLSGLGSLYCAQGEHARAQPLLERALLIRRKALGDEHPDVAESFNNLAVLYAGRGNLEMARSLYQQALSIYEKTLGSDHPYVAKILSNMAGLDADQGRYEVAQSGYAHALSITEKALGHDHLDVASMLNSLAVLHYKRRNDVEAALLLKRARSIYQNARRIGVPCAQCEVANLNNSALLSLDLGRYDSALAFHRQALDLEEENLSRALTVSEDSRRLAYTKKLFESSHYTFSLHLQAAPHNDLAAKLALTTLLRRKGRTEDLVAQSYAALRRSLPDEHQHILDELSSMRARYSALSSRDEGKDMPDTNQTRLRALEQEADNLWSELRKQSTKARALSDPLFIPDIQSRLSGDSALVEYVSYRAVFGAGTSRGTNESRYAAYVVLPHRFTWIDLGPAIPIDDRIRSFRDAITRKTNADSASNALYDAVMKPVVDRLGTSTTRLFIAPDGNLNLVPFAALVDEYDNHLVERFYLHYLTSGRDLLRPWMLEPVTGGAILIVANPAGADLPGTEREATLLASVFDDAVTMLHGDATETQLSAHERPRILHLATHGAFGTGRPGHTFVDASSDNDLFLAGGSVFDGLPPTQLDNPMLYSWLDLATPSNGQTDTDDAFLDDGKLTAYEISGWDLRGTELVTLSACDTAQGTYQQGEGILGLRRAFAIAGAQTQVMSLWKVSDTSTAKLMESYYRRLLAGEGRSEAMRSTQLELLRNPETRHPRDWAAFVVVGEWGPLSRVEPPVKADPEPLESRPRGCQATVAAPSDLASATFVLLPLLACARRRRASIRHRH